MEFTLQRVHQGITLTVHVTDGPIVAHPSSSTGKRMRVESVTVEFVCENGAWVVHRWSRVNVRGTVLKTDGTDSRNDYAGSVHDWEGRPEYAWLRALVKGMTPEGEVALSFRVTSYETDDLEGI